MNHIKLTQALFGVALITLLMFGCATPTTQIPPTASLVPPSATLIPPPATPTSTAGTIEGILVQKDTNKVLANRKIRLHQASLDTQAKKLVIPGYLGAVTKPVAETATDANGVFIFTGIQSGSYVLTAQTVRPMGLFEVLVSNDGKVIADVQVRVEIVDASGKQQFSSLVDAGRVLLVEVKPSQALSLGNVVIEDTSR